MCDVDILKEYAEKGRVTFWIINGTVYVSVETAALILERTRTRVYQIMNQNNLDCIPNPRRRADSESQIVSLDSVLRYKESEQYRIGSYLKGGVDGNV